MTTEPQPPSPASSDPGPSVEVPVPTIWPLVLSFGILLIASGVAFGLALSAVGLVLFLIGLSGWMSQILPGRGHAHEPLAGPEGRPTPITPIPGTVEQLEPGKPGYRFRLPEKVRPISAGIKGGLVGGLLMTIPALLYGLIHGLVTGQGPLQLFLPVNLLAGLVLPGLQNESDEYLSGFHIGLFLLAVVIHVVISLSLGLMYGVMLPTLPTIPRPLAWGGLLLPLLWSAVSFGMMATVNLALAKGVDWPWFIFSQFIFGVVAAVTILQLPKLRPPVAGAIGGVVGGVVMTIPAMVWGLLTDHGIWYPVNLLAGTVLPGLGDLPREQLQEFRPDFLAVAVLIHAVFSIGFGVVYGIVLQKLPEIPGPLSWGGVLMPLLWTGASYGLMGVMNPTLQQRVEWPWFVISQFVFGVAAAMMVLRSELIPVPPVGEPQEPRKEP
jgi:hypothetical protein